VVAVVLVAVALVLRVVVVRVVLRVALVLLVLVPGSWGVAAVVEQVPMSSLSD